MMSTNINYPSYLGRKIHILIDRKIGTAHPNHDFIYPCNYGYLPGTKAEDGEPIDVYLLGVYEPVDEFEGKCIAVIQRSNDAEGKLVICPFGQQFSSEQISALTYFHERYFNSKILTLSVNDQRQLFPVTAHIVLKDKQHVFLLRRANTGYEDGSYSLVAGHLDGGESVIQAAIRETLEEAGVTVTPEDLKINLLLHRMSDEERFDFILTATSWNGTPHNAEPGKCDHADWYPLDKLPDNIIPYIRFVLENLDHPDFYLRYGW